MKTHNIDIIKNNSIFLWVAGVTGIVVLIPLVAMKFTNEVNWGPEDFIVMSILLFGMGSLYILTARIFDKKFILIIGIAFAFVVLYLWAELAVGIFTNWGS